ncbi:MULTISPECIES: hypothetical protein [unclassified Beijerinckia]|uniref:hypothetical protein n=1 Tax=unclassified Beijerinckia TaxID=2638183 RepID=UPI00089B6D62|nr:MULTISPECIES: hypothetical protein [unclassified Beijerinckia]MDH7796452.1 hypothetical protein [Beijerinckia sp. GAS462]SEC45701.1 hypothetical protein SAMN05443249_2734 [Beijerinckia sp. 28-YEA-48]
MRIVDRKTFLSLPAGTIFAKFAAQRPGYVDYMHGEVVIKGETVADDFVVQDLFPWFDECSDTDMWMAATDQALLGVETPPMDYESDNRDALFDEAQLFAVWSKEDAERLVARLQKALVDGYS